ncbi:MAG: M23 family metallopeptidase, partial [Anaerolineales bacterium]
MKNLKFTGAIILLLLAVLAAQPVAAAKIRYSAQSLPDFSYPVSAEVGEGVNYSLESIYHQNADRYAIDFMAPGNNDYKKYGIYPTLPGRVVYAACKDEFYGCAVAIRHWDDTKWDRKYYSIYAHLESLNVALGDMVDVTTRIGWMGKTGAGGNGIVHLHFAV